MRYIQLLYGLISVWVFSSCLTDERASLISNSTFLRMYADEFNNEPIGIMSIENGYLCLATASLTNADGDRVSKIKLFEIDASGAVKWTKLWPEDNESGNYRAACFLKTDTGITVLADSLGENDAATIIDFSVDGQFESKQVLVRFDDATTTARAMSANGEGELYIALNYRLSAQSADQNNNIRLYSVSKQNDTYAINWSQEYGIGSDFILANKLFVSPEQNIFFAATNSQGNTASANTFKVRPNEASAVSPAIPTSTYNGSLKVNQLVYNRPADGMEELAMIGTVTVGSAPNTNDDIFFALLDGDGNVKSSGGQPIVKTFGDSNENEKGMAVSSAHGGGYVIAATVSEGGSSNIMIGKLYNDGREHWSEVYGGNRANEESAAIIKSNDGGYVVMGSTVFGTRAILLIKTNASGQLEYND